MFDDNQQVQPALPQMKRVNFSREQIEQLIPHRGLMLLLDGASVYGDLDNPTILGNYNVFQTSLFVQGHFPGRRVFPGFLIIEALAQTGSVLYSYLHPELRGKTFFLSSADNLRFRQPVFPNQPLFLKAKIGRVLHIRGKIVIKFQVEAFIMGEVGEEIIVANGKLSGVVLCEEKAAVIAIEHFPESL